jgi:pimeloyl-ACP methyl ester carboxylesterase
MVENWPQRRENSPRRERSGAAYPDFANTSMDATNRALLGIDASGTPNVAHLEHHLGDFAAPLKSWHSGCEGQWHAIVQQTARMWLTYPGLTPAEVGRIETPALVLTGDRDDLVALDLSVQLYKTLPHAELADCPQADHFGPLMPGGAPIVAAMIRDFAGRQASATKTRP